MMTGEVIFEINNVGVSYGPVRVLSGVTLGIRAGETFGLIGLNGAGKTSLIKSIIGLREQQEGTIKIYGQPPSDKNSRKRLSYLPERFEPAWFLRGAEFLKYSMRFHGARPAANIFSESALKLELPEEALKRRVQTYSKGMRQKLGLIGAILTGCDLLVLDEPMSGLDPRARTHVKNMLRECRQSGKTIFLSSHILADMDEMCDRIAIMHEGQIKFVGTPQEFKKLTGSEQLEQAFLEFIQIKAAA